MSNKIADKWFDGIDFVSIVDTIKGVMTSDGTMSTLLDFERVLDQCDLYAFKNWINGNDVIFTPNVQEGTIIFFPAGVLHYTEANLTDKKRMIISFNIECK